MTPGRDGFYLSLSSVYDVNIDHTVDEADSDNVSKGDDNDVEDDDDAVGNGDDDDVDENEE